MKWALLAPLCLLLVASCGSPDEDPPLPMAEAGRTGTRIPVWIDTDPSVTPGGHEVDDGFALLQAFHSRELDIRGIGVVFGNAPHDECLRIGREIVTRFGPQGMPVHAGASGASDLGRESPASEAMAEALRKEKLTILALGPVTNVATLLQRHPDLADRIVEIVAVAGRRPGQSFRTGNKGGRPFRDFNFELDSEGFRVLLASEVPIVLAPWEISSKVWLKEPDLQDLESGGEGPRWLVPASRDWLKRWHDGFGVDGFNPFDTLAVAYLTSPDWIRHEDVPAAIEVLPDDVRPDQDPPVTKPYLLASPEIMSGRIVRYCYGVAPEFKDDLMKRLLGR